VEPEDLSASEPTEQRAPLPATEPLPAVEPLPATEPLPVTASPGRRRSVTIAVAAGIWLAIAGVSAAIAANTGGSGSAVAAAVPSPSASVANSPSAAPTLPSATPTPTPRPGSTLKGYVNGSTHSGDLRFFLMPVPDDAEAYGDTDGTKESLSDIANDMGNSSTSKSILRQLGCTGGAYRTYRTNDGQYTVTARLIHFDSSGHAADWVTGLSFGHGDSFDVSGVSNAKAIAIKPTDSGGVGTLMGISHVGDMEYEIDIQGTGSLDHALLTPLMQRQEQLLSTGR
jgi:hypothetical protein